MQIGKFLQWQKELLLRFRNKNCRNAATKATIQRFEFISEKPASAIVGATDFLIQDSLINENRRFTYPVFVPETRRQYHSAILMLHGLNERSWDKYLTWAEYLALTTQKPVILFPIAYHINRAPVGWGNPRIMAPLVEQRKQEAGNPGSLSFANAALSKRLSEEPYRFYSSGRQTINDLKNLALQIRNGAHSLFQKGTSLDIFGYSIGSFLAEIMLMVNPGNLFSSSRLFVFCGGAIFRHMYGESRYIMDKMTYERLLHYYCHEWPVFTNSRKGLQRTHDFLQEAFSSMIEPEINREAREAFFSHCKTRIAGISLRKDKVMPFMGVQACMGNKLAGECFEVMDFPFEYTHESPFPAKATVPDSVMSDSFLSVFNKCAAFFA